MTVRCNIENCYWNKGTWCTRKVVSITNGTCSQLVMPSGQQRDPRYWQNPIFDEEKEDDRPTEEIGTSEQDVAEL